jgi:hypothetical protein
MGGLSKINRSCYFPENTTNLEKKINTWIGDIYQLLLNELKHGNIHPLLFDILDKEEFQRCFGFSAESVSMSHIRQHRK